MATGCTAIYFNKFRDDPDAKFEFSQTQQDIWGESSQSRKGPVSKSHNRPVSKSHSDGGLKIPQWLSQNVTPWCGTMEQFFSLERLSWCLSADLNKIVQLI